MADKIPILLFQINAVKRMGRRLRGFGLALKSIQPKLDETLEKMGLDLKAEDYLVGAFFSSLIYGFLFFLIGFIGLFLKAQGDGAEPSSVVGLAAALGLSFTLLFFMLHLIYPRIILNKIATRESKDLLFALRELMVDVDSGIPLFDSIKNVAESNYGYISKDFQWVVLQIENGVPEREALKALALQTESEYMKRAIWQMVNALESGASMGTALPGVVQALENHIYIEIKNYSSNLNFLMLIYMLGAAALPSLGVTFLVLLSAFGNFGVTVQTVGMLVAGSAFIQIVLIGYMTSTRPEIFGG
jgi:flagellar protein FlaJ